MANEIKMTGNIWNKMQGNKGSGWTVKAANYPQASSGSMEHVSGARFHFEVDEAYGYVDEILNTETGEMHLTADCDCEFDEDGCDCSEDLTYDSWFITAFTKLEGPAVYCECCEDEGGDGFHGADTATELEYLVSKIGHMVELNLPELFIELIKEEVYTDGWLDTVGGVRYNGWGQKYKYDSSYRAHGPLSFNFGLPGRLFVSDYLGELEGVDLLEGDAFEKLLDRLQGMNAQHIEGLKELATMNQGNY